ncbi:hypothetical protein YTPLAS72_12610 [Nitrospira sp.]|nr:hypothetical protein YTPLAS72_12610 [Nitrospira sp.]
MRRPLRTTWVLCTIFWWTLLHLSPGWSQTVAPITPSGLNTQVNLSAAPPAGTIQHDITGGTRTGANLFHSFGDFNVPNSHIANFLNDTGLDTANILGRVTGGNISTIFGTIQTTGFRNANLFLMNPAGIVFGPTASLNVGGSVAFTTANYLRLTDNTVFHALPNTNADALLSTAPVAAYGFLTSTPGAITIQGSQLRFPQEHSISLVGGNITIQNGTLENGTTQPARLSAPNGQLNLGATQSAGEFLQDLAAAPNIDGTSFRSYGSAHFASGSTADFSQTGNGTISIRGGQLVLDIQHAVLETSMALSPLVALPNQDTIFLAPGSSIVSGTSSEDLGPNIQVVTDHLQFLGSPPPSEEVPGTPVKVWARANGSGNAGDITVQTTGNLELLNQVRVESGAGFTLDVISPFAPVLAQGNAGNVALTSRDGNIQMTGSGTWATSQTGNSGGNTGTVTASAPDGEIMLDRGAALFTYASPQSSGGGHVKITGQNLRLMNFGLLSTDNVSPFKPEGITVTLSGKLSMEGNSFIVTSAFDPTAGAPVGDITLTAKDIVVTERSLISSETFAVGPGGQLKISAGTLQLFNGGQIKSGSTFAPPFGTLPQGITPSGPGGDITIQTLGTTGSIVINGTDSGIFTNTEGTGAGGSINLSAKSLTIQNGGTISASTTGIDSRATGGSIIVNATDQVTLRNGGSITASSVVNPEKPNTGIANAGNISLDAGLQLDMTNGSSITTATQSPQANGGNIAIRAIDRIQVVDSTISTSVLGAEGNGGNIFIDPKVVVLQGSEVTAKAVGGAGGNITFVTPLFLTDSASLVSASSERGPSGTVTIQSPTSNLSGAVGQLTAKTSPPQVLLQNRCVAKSSNQQSSFILAGRDALPADPSGWLSSPVAIEHWTGEDVEEHASGLMVRRIKPNQSSALLTSMSEGETLSLRGLTPPGFLVRTFATGLIGCTS